MNTKPLLQVEKLSKRFGKQAILQDVSFSLPAGEVLCILGRSGGGKTTLLKCLAGLAEPDAGRLWLEGRELGGMAPEKRNVVYLYQEPLLFPHLSAWENIAFGLRIRKQPEREVRDRVGEYVQELELEGHERKMPHQLSGGQKQRVNFGRSLIVNPAVLLLDEPFGKLDSQTRANMQVLFKRIARKYGITSVFVTHDVKEALLMGDRFARLDQGLLENYPDRAAFIRDERNGVRAEVDFWKGLIL